MINLLKTIYSKISNCCWKIINWIPDFDWYEEDDYEDDEW